MSAPLQKERGWGEVISKGDRLRYGKRGIFLSKVVLKKIN
jgi:hypothetical protein